MASKKPSPFHNMSTAELADEYGVLDAQIKALTERKESMRDELLIRIDDAPAIGERFTISRSDSTSRRIDTKAVREFLGDEAEQFETESTTTRLTVKPTILFGAAA